MGKKKELNEEMDKDTELTEQELTDDKTEETAEEEVSETAELEKELAAVKDTLLRTMAEYDNFRKRTARERQTLVSDAKAMTVEQLLPLLDNLERAVAVSPDTAPADILKGVEMVYSQSKATFEKLGVESFGEVGDVFDPNIHNAVSHIESEDFDENTISMVLQKGYKLGDKIVRPAMVQVAN